MSYLEFLQNLDAFHELFGGVFRAATAALFIFLKKKWELLGLFGSMWKLFGGVFSRFEHNTKFDVLFSVLFPEIPQIWEISWISGAGDSFAWRTTLVYTCALAKKFHKVCTAQNKIKSTPKIFMSPLHEWLFFHLNTFFFKAGLPSPPIVYQSIHCLK